MTVLLTAACASARAQVPLPADLSIQTPGASVPATDTPFSGAWGNGAWSGTRPTALVVERIAADGTADLIYALGASEFPKRAANWRRVQGHIEGHRLVFHIPDPNSSAGYRIEYCIVAPGRLEGAATNWDGWRGHAFLQRIPGPPSAIIATAALPVRPIWLPIWIPEHFGAGQTIQLEATLYRTRLPGRQPLVILNHGGSSPQSVKNTLHFEAQARFFLARGYNVVVPMRQGRGRSGGRSGMGINGAIGDLDAVVEAMRAKPWVDPARIVVAGWSRGGLTSVVYAARHPDKVAGAINFAGSWGADEASGAKEDRGYLAAAGKTVRAPELWLYAENDSYAPLAYGRNAFAAFRANGGKGELLTFGSIHTEPNGAIGEGHTLFEHVGMWKTAVAAYLRRIEGG